MIRVVLPFHLRMLAKVPAEVTVDVSEPATIQALLDALEKSYPALRGSIREHDTHKRRPLVRFFARQEDLSHEAPGTALPAEVVAGTEPFMIIGAIAGG